MRTGDYSKKEPTIIQVTGFDSNIDKGNYYEMLIPDIKYCKTVGRQCKVMFTYTMNEDTAFPYRISEREQSFGTVGNKEVPANIRSAGFLPSTQTWGSVSRSTRRCDDTSLQVQVRVERTIVKTDYIILKRHIDHWDINTFRSTSYPLTIISSSYTGSWLPVLNFEKNQEYLIHRFTADIPAPSPSNVLTFVVNNLVASPYIVPTPATNLGAAWIDVVLWAGKLKMSKGRAKPSGVVVTDNGFL